MNRENITYEWMDSPPWRRMPAGLLWRHLQLGFYFVYSFNYNERWKYYIIMTWWRSAFYTNNYFNFILFWLQFFYVGCKHSVCVCCQFYICIYIFELFSDFFENFSFLIWIENKIFSSVWKTGEIGPTVPKILYLKAKKSSKFRDF